MIPGRHDRVAAALLGLIAAALPAQRHTAGTRVDVSNGGDASVSGFDTGRNARITDITVGKLRWGMAIR